MVFRRRPNDTVAINNSPLIEVTYMTKRERVTEYILKLMTEFDRFCPGNTSRYNTMLESFSDNRFHEFMVALRDGKTQLNVIIPNNKSNITTNDVVALAKERNVKIFSKIYMYDMHSGRKYLTKYPMLILKLPVRRLSQYLFHKISLPDGDNHVNPVTGQVIPPDKGAALSAIETQVLASKGLSTSIVELLKIRAGDMNAYRSMKYTIEEQGDVSMTDIPMTGQPRSVITAGRYLHALMISSNL